MVETKTFQRQLEKKKPIEFWPEMGFATSEEMTEISVQTKMLTGNHDERALLPLSLVAATSYDSWVLQTKKKITKTFSIAESRTKWKVKWNRNRS